MSEKDQCSCNCNCDETLAKLAQILREVADKLENCCQPTA